VEQANQRSELSEIAKENNIQRLSVARFTGLPINAKLPQAHACGYMLSPVEDG
jgi:hypothetical protein